MAAAAAVDSDALRAWLDTVDFGGVVHIADGSSDAPAVTICRGLADRSADVPITPATRFGTASTTKLITGLAAARLVDRGRVSYEARVVELLDAASRPRDLDAAVTLGHLLSPTSGIGDYADDLDGPPYETIWEATPPGTIRRPADLLPLLRNVPPRAAPGDEVRYNNGAFVVAGLALEAMTGLTYPALVRDEVFAPLGMTSSGFWPLDGVEPDLAVGYLPPDPDAGHIDELIAGPAG